MASGTIGTAYVQIVPSAEGIKGSITNLLGGEADAAGNESGKSFGAKFVSVAKAAIAAAGIGTAIKASLDAGGAIQQSFGGLDTLYGEASSAAKQYAQEAAQAGISANSYAEQAVSFGAALKSAFGGDTTKAVKAANTAIMDMADNSAKMGTDIESIQNAYQGFAKGNYTMLDNLKLGYGGTRTEMERLLQDATKLSGVEYNIDNLGDVYDAIHVIQEDLGLTGVAAAEAQGTFTGSFDAMKASAENLLASLSAEELDVGPQMAQLVASASAFFFGNFLPMIGRIAAALPEAVVSLITTAGPILKQQGSTMVDILISAITNKLPEMLDKGTALVTNMVAGITNNLPTLIAKAGDLMAKFLDAILKVLPKVITSAGKIVGSLVTGIVNNLPKIVAAAGQVIAKILSTITSNLPNILNAGITLLGKFVAGIIQAIPKIPGAIKQCISSIKSTFTSVDWGSVGSNIIKGIAAGIRNGVGAIVNAAKTAAQNALKSAKNALGIHSPSRVFRDEVGKNIALGLAEGIEGNTGAVKRAMGTLSDVSVGSFNAEFAGSDNSGDAIGKLLSYLQLELPKLANQKIVLDTGVFVGETVQQYDAALGNLAYKVSGGVY